MNSRIRLPETEGFAIFMYFIVPVNKSWIKIYNVENKLINTIYKGQTGLHMDYIYVGYNLDTRHMRVYYMTCYNQHFMTFYRVRWFTPLFYSWLVHQHSEKSENKKGWFSRLARVDE